jgi:hypothetical protein
LTADHGPRSPTAHPSLESRVVAAVSRVATTLDAPEFASCARDGGAPVERHDVKATMTPRAIRPCIVNGEHNATREAAHGMGGVSTRSNR